MAHDLQATADANGPGLAARADALAASSGAHHRFRDAAARCQAATSVKAHKVKAFEELQSIVCGRRLMAHELSLPVADPSVESTFAIRQQGWYRGRTSFEDCWHDGRQAIYTALVLSGLGLSDFGEYTLIVRPEISGGPSACIPGNSAELYWDGTGFDEARCLAEAAPWASRGDLLLVKEHVGLLENDTTWPTRVCRQDHFSEMVHLGSIPLSAIGEIRVSAADYRHWLDLSVDKGNGKVLQPSEETEVEILALLHRWSADLGASIVEV